MAETNKHPSGLGISGLPRPWSTVVQLVGTFGLAVFLVLYYVLVIHPQEEKRYEELKNSVQQLSRNLQDFFESRFTIRRMAK